MLKREHYPLPASSVFSVLLQYRLAGGQQIDDKYVSADSFSFILSQTFHNVTLQLIMQSSESKPLDIFR